MHFIYPQDVIERRRPDELFREEASALEADGHGISLMDTDALGSGASPIRPPVEPQSEVIYRGWMLTPEEYQAFVHSVEQQGAKPFTSLEQYLSTHYLPHWYSLLADLTPETVFLDEKADLVASLAALCWPRFFIKDYVKSLKTAGGSAIDRPEEISRVVAEMRKYRGKIEGGLCVRHFEEFVPGSERRYFVVEGVCHGSEPDGRVPALVRECARRLGSRFFSVDVAARVDGLERVVEVGDGQVSDRVSWSVGRFAALWQRAG